MGKRYDSEKAVGFIEELENAVGEYTEKAGLLDSAYKRYVANDTFLGKAAEASKLFVVDKQSGFNLEQHEIQRKLLYLYADIDDLFKNNVDTADDARIDTDVLEETKGKLQDYKDPFDRHSREIEGKACEIEKYLSEYSDFIQPSYEGARVSAEKLCGDGEFIDTCIRNFVEFDEESCLLVDRSELEQDVEKYISSVSRTASALDDMQIDDPQVEDVFVKLVSFNALNATNVNLATNANSSTNTKSNSDNDISLIVPKWIQDALGDDWRQYFEVTDDGFFICTVPMNQLFEKAGLTKDMQRNVEDWYLFGVYDPNENPPKVTYGAVVINRHGDKGIEGSSLPFTAIDMDLLGKTIDDYKAGKPLDVDSVYVAIAPVLLCDDEAQYYNNPNKKLYKYFRNAGKDGSILIANLIVQDNLNRRFSPHSSGGTTVDGVFPYKYDNYCSQSRDFIDSLIEKGICAKDPDTGTITMTIQDPDKLSMDEYNALLMMTTDDQDIYAYIAENAAHADACKYFYHRESASQSDCWPGENPNADENAKENGTNTSSGSEDPYKDSNGRYYKKAVEKHKDQFSN